MHDYKQGWISIKMDQSHSICPPARPEKARLDRRDILTAYGDAFPSCDLRLHFSHNRLYRIAAVTLEVLERRKTILQGRPVPERTDEGTRKSKPFHLAIV